jgi:hypothetical protein
MAKSPVRKSKRAASKEASKKIKIEMQNSPVNKKNIIKSGKRKAAVEAGKKIKVELKKESVKLVLKKQACEMTKANLAKNDLDSLKQLAKTRFRLKASVVNNITNKKELIDLMKNECKVKTPAKKSRKPKSPKVKTPVKKSRKPKSPKVKTPARVATPKQLTPARVATPKQLTPARVATPKQLTPARVATPKQLTPARVATPKVKTPARVATPKVKTPARVATPKQLTLVKKYFFPARDYKIQPGVVYSNSQLEEVD